MTQDFIKENSEYLLSYNYKFKKDGTFTRTDNSEYQRKGTWEVENNLLLITDKTISRDFMRKGSEYMIDEFTIENIDSETMVLSDYQGSIITFKKGN